MQPKGKEGKVEAEEQHSLQEPAPEVLHLSCTQMHLHGRVKYTTADLGIALLLCNMHSLQLYELCCATNSFSSGIVEVLCNATLVLYQPMLAAVQDSAEEVSSLADIGGGPRELQEEGIAEPR